MLMFAVVDAAWAHTGIALASLPLAVFLVAATAARGPAAVALYSAFVGGAAWWGFRAR